VHIGMLLDLRDPVANGLEGPTIGDVVNEQDALRAAEVGRGDGAESLLAGRVPDLELDALAIDLDVLDFEVDADGGDEGRGERVVRVTQEEARFAHAGVSDHEQFDLHVIRGGLAHDYIG